MILYKYLPLERIDVLTNCKIRYSQPSALNDPFEVQLPFDKFTNDSDAINTFEKGLPEVLKVGYQQLPKEVRKKVSFEDYLREAKKLVPNAKREFLSMLDQAAPKVRDMLTLGFHEKIGILSLTETPINILMWSHYADSHKGFVIGLDTTHPYFDQRKSDSDEFHYLRKVEYRKERPTLTMVELDGTEVLLVKGSQWEHEKEWRIIKPLYEGKKKESDSDVYLFDFPSDIVREIILGCKMPGKKKDELVSLVRSRFDKVQIYEARLDVKSNSLTSSII